jgi:hypothetical protein
VTNSPGGGEQPGDPYGGPSERRQDPSGQPGYGQAPYGVPAYGVPPYGQPAYGVPAPTHSRALAAMVVGIVSLVLACGYGVGLLGSPVAWWLGARAKREIDASHGQLGGRGMAQAGVILGIVGTVFLALVIVAVAVGVMYAVNQSGGTSTSA